MARVLVTGNEGYIGSVLTDHLLEAGHEVVGLDIGMFRAEQFIPKKHVVQQQIYKDIRDVEERDFEGVDTVIHLAGLSRDGVASWRPAFARQINGEGAVRVGRIAKQAGVRRFFLSSSVSVYGRVAGKIVNELSAVDPLSPYALSKVEAEDGLRVLADETFSPVYFRNAGVYGLSPRMSLDLIVNNLVVLGCIDGFVTVVGDGLPWRPLIHIEDLAAIYTACLALPVEHLHNQIINIGQSEDTFQVLQIAEMVQAMITKVPLIVQNQPAYRATWSVMVNYSKMRNLGLSAKKTVKEGIAEMQEQFLSQGFSRGDYALSAYHVLSRFQELLTEGYLGQDLRPVTSRVKNVSV